MSRPVQSLDVLVTEPVMGRFEDVLTRHGSSPHRWRFAYDDDIAAGAARQSDVLVCSSAAPGLVASLPRPALVHVTGAGTDRIPALSPGLSLCNTAHHGDSIAEHVLMVSMMLLRRAREADRDVRAGRWRNAVVDQDHPFGGLLAGRTLGIVGFGEIGSTVGRLGSALGMRVRTVRRDPGAPLPSGVDVEWVGSRDELGALLAASDVVVVTVPLTEPTRGLIDAEALAAMRRTAILVNVARGPVVDEAALHAALSEGRIAGAGIDVWWRNPREPDAPPPSHLDFTGFDNVVLTPHQSGHTREVFAARARDIADNVDAFAEGRPLRNLVAHLPEQ